LSDNSNKWKREKRKGKRKRKEKTKREEKEERASGYSLHDIGLCDFRRAKHVVHGGGIAANLLKDRAHPRFERVKLGQVRAMLRLSADNDEEEEREEEEEEEKK
jgi:hypothetical protein